MSAFLNLLKSVLSLLVMLIRYVFYRAVSSFLTGIVLLFVAVLMFVTFHQAYMPLVSHVKPVYLQFRSDCQDGHTGLCSYPEASVFFTPQNKANDERMLMRGQSYKVFLDIDMPSSPTNEKLGMFMVNLKFLSAKGTVLQSSSRSCMLHYESNLVRLFRTLFYSLPLTLGLTEEKQKVEINFFDDYIDDSYNPAVQAKVVIMSKQVEIYSSTLRLQASFTGLRYIIFNWPVLFACLAVLGNFITVTLIYSACVNQFYSTAGSRQTNQSQRSMSAQQNGAIGNSQISNTRSALPASHDQLQTQQQTDSLPQQNGTQDYSACEMTQAPVSNGNQRLNSCRQTLSVPVCRKTSSTLCKAKNYRAVKTPLGRAKFSKKGLKIHNLSKANNEKTKNINRQEQHLCDDVEHKSPHNIQCPSGSLQDITEVLDTHKKLQPESDCIFENTSPTKNCYGHQTEHKVMIGLHESTPHVQHKKKFSKKTMSVHSKKCKHNPDVNTKLQSDLPSKSAAEFSAGIQSVLDSFCFTRKWATFRLPRVRRLGRYLEENIPLFTKSVRHCISDLELSTFEENRFHATPVNHVKRSASTSDLTPAGAT